MKYVICLVVIFTACLPLSLASAQNKVVVIPLNSSKSELGGISTVTSAGGLVWMDRNLGALRVATKSADPDAYGTLYQWGRMGDGHEYRSSSTLGSQSSGNVPGHGSFITEFSDWTSSPNPNLWQGESCTNNPCPAGFRLPTEAEWQTERASWISQDSAGAFASPLRLPAAGVRYNNGAIDYTGSDGGYWSATVDDNGSYNSYLGFSTSLANMFFQDRAYGFSVRCVKD